MEDVLRWLATVLWGERRPQMKLKKNVNRSFLGDFFFYNKYNRDNFESEIKFGMLKKCQIQKNEPQWGPGEYTF